MNKEDLIISQIEDVNQMLYVICEELKDYEKYKVELIEKEEKMYQILVTVKKKLEKEEV